MSSDVESFTEFIRTTPVEFACAAPRRSSEGIVTAHVLMRQSVADRSARSKGIRVEVVADLSDTTGERRAEVGRGNRFADPTVLPQGRGRLVRDAS